LEEYGKTLYYQYKNIIEYLISRGYLVKIFEGIYYVKSREEFNSNIIKLTPLELISECLKLKSIQKWYFGLYTALTLNGIKNNHDQEIYVLNDHIFKPKPTKIKRYKLKFLQVKSNLLNFGILKDKVYYSDLEKTILDFIYLWKFNEKNNAAIIQNISNYLKYVSKEKIIRYSREYPESNRKILKELISNPKIRKKVR
ncbi:MAG: hypothetical protein ACFE8L_14790, partial [Candidatus Hodarchaeota archaeon]